MLDITAEETADTVRELLRALFAHYSIPKEFMMSKKPDISMANRMIDLQRKLGAMRSEILPLGSEAWKDIRNAIADFMHNTISETKLRNLILDALCEAYLETLGPDEK